MLKFLRWQILGITKQRSFGAHLLNREKNPLFCNKIYITNSLFFRKMVKLNSIVRFLNKELRIRSIEDKSKNGLQVKTNKEIKKIGFAVDACLGTFKKAKKAGCDLLIVHHGLLWKHKRDVTGVQKKRINWLKKNKIGLYAAHLPLDAHPKHGNNIQLAKLLELEKIKRFARHHGSSIGFVGSFKKTMALKSIANKLNKTIKTKCRIFPSGKKRIKKIAILSGRSRSLIPEAVKVKPDCVLTGEVVHGPDNEAKDLQINLIAAGHYATETLGVKALMPLIKEKFNIQTIFIDNPTGL